MMKCCATLFLFLLSLIAVVGAHAQTTVYVDPSAGSDANPGTLSAPFQTIAKGIAGIPGGGIVYLRGGTYSIAGTTRLTLSAVGTAANRYRLWAYPGERPVIDFSGQTNFRNIYEGGIEVSGQYWHLKGLHQQNNYNREGCILTGSYNIIENCSFRRNGLNAEGNGLMLYGRSDAPANAHNNLILNCDAYDNFSGTGNGGNSDGFGILYNIGPGNVFRGCRAWNNSDDGFDCWRSTSSVLFDSCSSFGNGLADGNGQGFKMGGSNDGTQAAPHVWRNCVAAKNKKHGFDQNGNLAGQTLYNCTAYGNRGANYNLSTVTTSGAHVVKNCVSYLGSMGNTFASPNTQVTNSWQGFTVSSADFASLDSTGEAGRPRKADGSLPASKFLRLASASDLLSAGTNVGIPFPGLRPDIGALGVEGPTNPPPPPPPLGVPTLLSPANGAVITPPSVTLRWQRVAGSLFYHLQVAESSDFQNALVNDSSLTDTLRLVSSLKAGTTYYVRVREKTGSAWSNYGATVKFSTSMPPPPAPQAPTVVAPQQGASLNPTPFAARWKKVNGAVLYQLQLATNANFQPSILNDSTLSDTSRQISSLSSGTTYYIRVRAKSTSIWGSFGGTVQFSTTSSPPPPSAPGLITPAAGALFSSSGFTARWRRVTGATRYHLQVAENSGFQSPAVNDSTLADTLRALGSLKSGTTYYIRVRAKGTSSWSSYCTPVQFGTYASTPQAPSWVSPGPGVQVEPAYTTARWRRVSGTVAYQVQLSESSGFRSLVFNDSTVVDTMRRVGRLRPGRTYYLRVRAKGLSATWTSYGATLQFLTSTFTSPRKGSQGIATSFVASWYKDDGATRYHLQVANNIAFSNPFVNDSTVVDTVRLVSGLKESVQYYCRLRVKTSSWSAFSETVDFKTGSVSSADQGNSSDLPTSYSLSQNYPNPFNPTTSIRFSLPVRGRVLLSIFNMLGQTVRELVNGEREPGVYEIKVDGAGLASGMYLYRLQAAGFVDTKRFVLLK